MESESVLRAVNQRGGTQDEGKHLEITFRSKDADTHRRGIRMNRRLVSKFRKKLEKLPVADYHGLSSPGLTCYLNSVLQVLFMTENFRDAVKRFKSRNHRCDIKDPQTIDLLLRSLFKDLEKKRAETRNITATLGITDVFEQRDAAEYFEKILHLTSPDASKIFKGELNQRITCCQCNMRNESRSSFWVLPLTVEESAHKPYNVKRGLEAFFELQKVSEDDQIYCSRCDGKQDANIKSEITQYPDVLTLLLKRFTFDYKLKLYVKLLCEAHVPQTLHMEKCTYDLYAVVNHFGSLTGGHYTAEIKSFETGWWYYFDDDSVKSFKQRLFGAEKTSLRSSTAYILLYRKVSKEPAETDGRDRGAQRAHSEVEAEGGRDEVERGEAPVLHYQPERYNDKGEVVLKYSISDLSKNYCDDQVLTNSSGELEKDAKQRAANMNRSVFPQFNAKASEQQLDPVTKEDTSHRGENSRAFFFQQNSNTQKTRQKGNRGNYAPKTGTKTSRAESSPRREQVKPVETTAEENKEAVKYAEIRGNSRPDRQRGNTVVSTVDEKSYSIYSNGYSSSAPHRASFSSSHHKTSEPCISKDAIKLDRKSSSLNSNMVKTQHVVVQTTNSGPRKLCQRDKKNCKCGRKQKMDNVVTNPWR